MNTTFFQCIDRVTGFQTTGRGIEVELGTHEHEMLRVDVLCDDVIRLKISRNRVFDETPTHAVCADLVNVQAGFSVENNDKEITVRTSAMSLTVYREPFVIEARRADGSFLLQTHVDNEGRGWAYATLNDEFVVRRRCKREDAFYGLGEKTGRFNRRGRNFALWNSDVLSPSLAGGITDTSDGSLPTDPTSTEFDPYYISIPFFYHMPIQNAAMSGFFIDNSYRGRFEWVNPEEYLFHFEGGQYTEYLFAGPSMRDILASYTWLTGRISPPPLWSLGYHQCRWFAYTQEKVEALAEKMRSSEIPCDVIWLDIDHMDGYRVFTWDRKRFPTPEEMIARLRGDGFRVVTIIDPGVKYEHGYAVFDEAVQRDVLCKTEGGAIYLGQVWPGRTAFPDFVKPEARKWWGELNAKHVRSGLSGIWNDMNEPATGDIPDGAMRFDGGRAPHARYHNQYALLMAMGTVEGLLAAMPDKRTFVLSRAGSAGIQRYAANWLGDNMSRWEHLWMGIPMALGLGISGQPFVGADIGGFMENSNPELLVRWYQYGALTPFCWNHNSANQADQYPWVFGEIVEKLCKAAIDLRYRLMPYIYASFCQAAETGSPVQRPLLFDFQSDLTTREIDDEYLFGDALLVAPIYTEGCTERQVYLPAGTWHHWQTGEVFSGKQFVVAAAPMDYIPVYARGGTIIPMWPSAPKSTMDYHPTTIELHVFLPREDSVTRSFLQEDDGQSFAIREGGFWRTEFVLRKDGARVRIEATVSGKGYPEFRRERFAIVIHGGKVTNLTGVDNLHRLTADSFELIPGTADFSIEMDLT